MSSELIIRPMEHSDLESIMELEHLCFSIPWTRGMFEEELLNPGAIYIVAEVEGRICGYAGMWKVIDEGHITNIAVHPDYRRRGYGAALIENLISIARNNGINAITLEVRPSNRAAISLYERFGFKTFGRRKNYYADNNEDALIMWLNLE
ncbi:MAG: ribosomal protein S18-alanine N-acetyltransferase [Clostridiaceae bacterium]|nr:ribosomal protein S18-alanine N-acetyltransferase [Clostridiaceae bacterium]